MVTVLTLEWCYIWWFLCISSYEWFDVWQIKCWHFFYNMPQIYISIRDNLSAKKTSTNISQKQMRFSGISVYMCVLTCHWWWSHWWHSICVSGSPPLPCCWIVHSGVSWPGWHVPSSAEQGCCRSHYIPDAGLAPGSAGWIWCYLLRRVNRWNTET